MKTVNKQDKKKNGKERESSLELDWLNSGSEKSDNNGGCNIARTPTISEIIMDDSMYM